MKCGKIPMSELKDIPIEKVKRGEYQPRRDFNQEKLEELAESIKSQGVIQPIVVRPLKNNEYEIIAGERRWRASQLAQLAKVPCIIKHYTNEETAAVSLIENVQRDDLNPIEEAQAYQRMIDEFYYSHEEIAYEVGKSRAKISNILRLLNLDKRIQQFLVEEVLSEGHAKVLLSLDDVSDQMFLAEKAVKLGWSVRKLDQEIKRIKKSDDLLESNNDPNVAMLEREWGNYLGSAVKIDYDTNGKGKVIIDFDNVEILQGIVDRTGFED
jgi:ParB family transcriptional regulator, chromosome partitioning protein